MSCCVIVQRPWLLPLLTVRLLRKSIQETTGMIN